MEEKKTFIFILKDEEGIIKPITFIIEQTEGSKKHQPIKVIFQFINILISIMALVKGFRLTLILEASVASNKIIADEHRRSINHRELPYNPKNLSWMEMLMMHYRYTMLYDNDQIAYIFGITASGVQKHCSNCFLLYNISILNTDPVRSLMMSKVWLADFPNFADPFSRKDLSLYIRPKKKLKTKKK